MLTATAGTIDAAQRAGHFDGYPALPVAMTMQTLVDAAGELMHFMLGQPSGFAMWS